MFIQGVLTSLVGAVIRSMLTSDILREVLSVRFIAKPLVELMGSFLGPVE